jgi:hypothetical protein
MPFASFLGFVDDSSARPLSDAAHSLIDDLAPSLIRAERVDSWPGTRKLDGKTANRFLYSLDLTVLQKVFKVSSGLFDWTPSALPRDLHLLRSDQSPVLTTVALEHRAWLDLSDADWETWRRNSPVDVLRLVEAPAGSGQSLQLLVPLAGTKIGGRLVAGDLASLVGELPEALVRPIAEYLRSGALVLKVPGVSRDELNGSFEVHDGGDLLTDGSFVWRRDAADYVQNYAIGLPETVAESFAKRDWTFPALTEDELEALEEQIWLDL